MTVLSGTPAFVFARGEEEVRLQTEPGDYIFVPPFVPHREENPGRQRRGLAAGPVSGQAAARAR